MAKRYRLDPHRKGYVPCACRDCFDVAIGDGTERPAYCHDCETAGCEDMGLSECMRTDAYDCGELASE